MRQRYSHIPWLLWRAALFVLPLAGCQSREGGLQQQEEQEQHAEPQQYADAYKALMLEYRAKMVKLSARPLPARSTPAKEKRARLAKEVEELAEVTAGFARRMNDLKPPADFQQVHSATQAFFQASAEGNRKWAAAIHAGKGEDVKQALHQAEQAEARAMARMAEAVEKAGGEAKAVRRVIQEMVQERE